MFEGEMADHTTHFCRTWFHQVQHIPGTMKCFSIINQLWGTSLQFMSSLGLQQGLGASRSVLFA